MDATDVLADSVTALIPAAGRSSRMGTCKPLLSLGGETALEKVFGIVRRAGIGSILTILGHDAELLLPILARHQVPHVINNRYEEGMFSSLQAGVARLDAHCRAFMVLPADMPLIRPDTLRRLLAAFRAGAPDILVCRPRHGNRRGHPPLISTHLAADLLAHDGAGGLRSLLARFEGVTRNVDVIDSGILIDLDTRADLAAWRDLTAQKKRRSPLTGQSPLDRP
ncbi:MAG: nucleotidyltransferase family protein [Pseudomonadota bacterium]|nr:nucleotidyltransferase family protein [Pseudomonadota bacterium]